MEARVSAEQCPKCRAFSGDDWRRCGSDCPMGAPEFLNFGKLQVDFLSAQRLRVEPIPVPNRLFGVVVNEYGEAI